MKLTSRDIEIIKYARTHTLLETGQKFNVTAERVRQIKSTKNKHFCVIHKRLFYNKCSFCLLKKYEEFIGKLSYTFLLVEIEKQAKNRKRDYLSTQYRVCLIRILHDKYETSFSEIAKLLKKDYSTISYLYHNHE